MGRRQRRQPSWKMETGFSTIWGRHKWNFHLELHCNMQTNPCKRCRTGKSVGGSDAVAGWDAWVPQEVESEHSGAAAERSIATVLSSSWGRLWTKKHVKQKDLSLHKNLSKCIHGCKIHSFSCRRQMNVLDNEILHQTIFIFRSQEAPRLTIKYDAKLLVMVIWQFFLERVSI